MVFDRTISKENKPISQTEMGSYVRSVSILAIKGAVCDIPELVIRNTVVPVFLKRPSEPRRFSTMRLSVFPSSALKQSSSSMISQRAYTARARAYCDVSKVTNHVDTKDNFERSFM